MLAGDSLMPVRWGAYRNIGARTEESCTVPLRRTAICYLCCKKSQFDLIFARCVVSFRVISVVAPLETKKHNCPSLISRVNYVFVFQVVPLRG